MANKHLTPQRYCLEKILRDTPTILKYYFTVTHDFVEWQNKKSLPFSIKENSPQCQKYLLGTWTSSPSTPGQNHKGQDWERNAENCQVNDLMQKSSSWKPNKREHGNSTSCAIWDLPQHKASSVCALGRHWLRRCTERSVPLSLPDCTGEKSGEAREWRREL